MVHPDLPQNLYGFRVLQPGWPGHGNEPLHPIYAAQPIDLARLARALGKLARPTTPMSPAQSLLELHTISWGGSKSIHPYEDVGSQDQNRVLGADVTNGLESTTASSTGVGHLG
ncbi:hypothetical protein [Streptomyces sp. NPDC001933]|uniref:hypothetical protein n=1 Tax=Streptomyces sp. NPDC001933 TaxID=3364626 RepID=UPI0036A771B7